MTAVLRDDRMMLPLTVAELDSVMAIERAAYEFPWTRGNFIDSLHAGYDALVLSSAGPGILGYFVALPGVDEMHLLNITVAPDRQGEGHARYMLGSLVGLCRDRAARQLWLEVRESNERARALYVRFGFRHVGARRGYYPASPNGREDAVVMSLDIPEIAG